MPIRAVTFDWGDTLASNHTMPYDEVQQRGWDSLAAGLNSIGAKVGPDTIAAWNQDLMSAWYASGDQEANPENVEMDYQGLLTKWLGSCGLEINNPVVQPIIMAYARIITDIVVQYHGVRETLGTLQSMGVRVGILSHVPWPGYFCQDWYRRNGLASLVDFYSFSSDVGFIKPHRAHYQHALDLAGCAADEVLHVGDHPNRDVIGGREFGFKTCLKLTQGVYDEELLKTSGADFRIVHVKEVPEIVAGLS